MYFETITDKNIYEAVKWLEGGEVVGIPTETVYGLAGNALNSDAVLKIFTVKNRPHFDPLIVHAGSVEQLLKYVADVPDMAQNLMSRFMPGPLTLLLKKRPVIPDLVTSGLDTVAVRVPDHPLTLQLLGQLSFPLAAPSANPFGYISPTSAQHVANQLANKIPYILDGGISNVGVESTIVGFDGDVAVIHRLGGLAVEEIQKITGKVRFAINNSSNPAAPGMLRSHYAPKTTLFFGGMEQVRKEISGYSGNENIAVIACDNYVQGVDERHQTLLSPNGDLNEAARNLFAIMRKLDGEGLGMIYAVEFPENGLGLAINDRLRRAAFNF